MLALWLATTRTPPDQQGKEVLKELRGTAKEAVWVEITNEQLVAPNGANNILRILQSAYPNLGVYRGPQAVESFVYGNEGD